MSTGIHELDTLRNDVTDLKVAIAGMKPHVEQIPHIAKSLSILAEVMPRLEANMEDHKRIYLQIEAVNKLANSIDERLNDIEIEHSACMQKQRITDRLELESASYQIKKAAIPVIITAILTFFGWMLITHIPEYVKIVNKGVAK